MGEKSEQKRQYILDCAKKVFMEKGFRSVTMKDIVDACEISRGGLYLYFSSTEEIFLEVLKRESEADDDVFSANIREDAMAVDILLLFFKEQKKELLRKKDDLAVATYEYYFANGKEQKENLWHSQHEAAVRILQKLIDKGMENGEFYEVDSAVMARTIMLVIEGMKIVAHTGEISESMIDRQFGSFVEQLCIEE